MLSLNATQLAIVASTAKKVTYLFDIDLTGDGTVDYYYGFEPKTWATHSYIFKVIGFDPITLSKGSPESGILTPSTTTIKLTNKDNTLTASTFEGATITVRCIMQDAAGVYTESEIMAWTFKVKASSSILQTISLECEDWFAGYLRGDYPNTRLVSDLFPYPASKKDNVCVPLTFGTPFFPLRWIPKNNDADYVDTTHFYVAGDQTALFAAGQFLISSCGVDGVKSCFVESNTTSDNCVHIIHNGGANPGIYQTINGFEIGQTYRVSVFTKRGTEATIIPYFPTVETTFEAPIDWEITPHTFDKTATATSNTLYFVVACNSVGIYAIIGRIKVQKINNDGTLGPNLVENGNFYVNHTGWLPYNSANLQDYSGGMASTRITLTAASDDLTANLTTVQTDHYLLGSSSLTYTISEARTPKDFGSKSTYLPASYTFKQDTITGSDGTNYKAVQVIVPNYSNIQFKPPECMDVPFRLSRSDLVSTTNLANIVNYILLDFGIAAGRIDSDAVTAAAAIYTTNSLVLNVGLYFQQTREKVLAKLMALGAMIPIVRDKIYLKVLSTTSVRTLTKADILPGTFSLQRKKYTQDEKDSGYVVWQTAGEPQDQANKSLISVKTGVAKPADTTIEAEWVDTSVAAKKSAKLALQKSILAAKEISFKSDMHLSALEHGDMITINDADLGGTYPAMIDRVTYDQKSNLSFICTVFSDTLNDWADLTETDIQIYATDASKGYSNVIQGPSDSVGGGPNLITGAVLIGDGGEFKTCVSPETTGGFKATNEALTCYNASGAIRFQALYAGTDQGDVAFGDYPGAQGVKWDQSAGKLDIKGRFTAIEGSIGGWTLAATKFSGTGLEFDSTNIWMKAFTGSNSVTISPAGIVGHDNTLGDVFKLLTNGSAPEFSSGVIKECEYQLYTAGIIRTNANPATNGGFLLDSAKLVGYVSGGDERFRIDLTGPNAGDVTIGNYAGGQGIKWDQSAALLKVLVTATGGISVSGGGDITIAGNDTDPGIINFNGTTYSVKIGGDTDGNRFAIIPSSNNLVDFTIGDDAYEMWYNAKNFKNIYLKGASQINMASGAMTSGVAGAGSKVTIDSTVSMYAQKSAVGIVRGSIQFLYNYLAYNFALQGGVKFTCFQTDTWSDDTYYVLPSCTAGIMLWMTADGGGNRSALWLISSLGGLSSIAYSGGTAFSDSDGNICLFNSGGEYRFKNRAGVELDMICLFWYF